MNVNDQIKELFKIVGIKKDQAITLDDGSIEIEPEYEISPNDFIDFAEQDLLGKDNRSLVNALSNAKRAIDCRIDMILKVLNISLKKLKKNKFEVLNELGVLAPRIIQRTRKSRNLLEHEYILPKYNIVSNAIDVAMLFNAYAQRVFIFFPEVVHLVNTNTPEGTYGKLFSSEIQILFEKDSYIIEGIKDNNYLTEKITINVSDEIYYILTKVYITAHMERNQKKALNDLFQYLDYKL